MRRRTERHLTAVAVLVAVPLLFLLILETGRRDPARVDQSYWYRIGTESRTHRFETLPSLHPVVVVPLDSSVAGVWVGTLLPPTGVGRLERGGRFDPETGVITILGREARLEAELAVPLRPTLARTLRHEYGHALLSDWLHRLTDAESALVLLRGAATPFPNADAFPKALRPVIEEYNTTRVDIYGSTYYTSAFDEYLAESYARYLGGSRVGPEARRFLVAIEEHPLSVR